MTSKTMNPKKKIRLDQNRYCDNVGCSSLSLLDHRSNSFPNSARLVANGDSNRIDGHLEDWLSG